MELALLVSFIVLIFCFFPRLRFSFLAQQDDVQLDPQGKEIYRKVQRVEEYLQLLN